MPRISVEHLRTVPIKSRGASPQILMYAGNLAHSRPGYAVRFNSLRPRWNRRHSADYIFICIFLNENISISINIPPQFIPKGPINNIPALVQIMAWRWPGDKPLSAPIMIILLTHIYVTRSQWFNHVSQGWLFNNRRWVNLSFEVMKWRK